MAIGGDVETVGVEGDAHFGVLGRRFTLFRLGLKETRDGLGDLPNLVIENAVEDHRGVGPAGGQSQPDILGLRRLGSVGEGGPDGQRQQQKNGQRP